MSGEVKMDDSVYITVNGYGECSIAVNCEGQTWICLFFLCEADTLLRSIARQAADCRCQDMSWHRAAVIAKAIRDARDNTELSEKRFPAKRCG